MSDLYLEIHSQRSQGQSLCMACGVSGGLMARTRRGICLTVFTTICSQQREASVPQLRETSLDDAT